MRLAAVRLGWKWVTTPEAVARFMAALTAAPPAAEDAPRTPAAGNRAAEAAGKELERLARETRRFHPCGPEGEGIDMGDTIDPWSPALRRRMTDGAERAVRDAERRVYTEGCRSDRAAEDSCEGFRQAKAFLSLLEAGLEPDWPSVALGLFRRVEELEADAADLVEALAARLDVLERRPSFAGAAHAR